VLPEGVAAVNEFMKDSDPEKRWTWSRTWRWGWAEILTAAGVMLAGAALLVGCCLGALWLVR
jgi:hypothetical protein